ncbi:MAG: c-type cytochrome [Myxococcales bacterium]|nr:c-type cytochrome [Myxococcales bacterium]MBK7194042.1 c-type cytochrome [Myxococcales bacterium]MBP6846070.1 c-type cytochrome [Kofleriaceae bacterium]
MTSRTFSTALAVALGLTLAACGGSKSDNAGAGTASGTAAPAPTPTPAPTGDPTAKAKEIFSQRCVPCHGAEGKGDGVASKGLTPPPRNFGDPAWQASVTDEHIEKIIHYGGAAVGKAPTMPANPDLSDPAVLAALRAHVRSLGGK